MKIIICILLTAAIMQVSASAFAQRVSFKKDQVSLKEVFDSIQQQTGYSFIISSDLLKKTGIINVNLRNLTIQQALDKCFAELPLDYFINKKTIVVNERKDPAYRQPGVNTLSVTGKITDENQNPISGLSVKVKNSAVNAISNAEGIYRISVPDQTDTLVFTSIGYTTQELPVTTKTVINVVLNKQVTGLDEVIVIGYGQVNRRDLTGSVGSVSIPDLALAPVKSFDEALAGRVAGVQVASEDGQPGAPINIVIRGTNSVTQDNSPLYVVDGFPIENNDNNAINPADIESIDILKDASATAIYGARGANGVIMITTKRGKVGAPVVTYNGFAGFQNNTRKIELLSPYEYIKLQLELAPTTTTTNYLTDGKTLDSYKTIEPIDWYDKIAQSAFTHSHNVSVSGGTAKSRFSASGSLIDQDGIVKYTGFRRYQGKITMDQTINSKMKFGMSANYSDSKSYGTFVNNAANSSTSGTFMYSVWGYRPLEIDKSLVDEDIEDVLIDPLFLDASTDSRVNPLIQARNELRESKSTNIFSNFYVEYSIARNLKLRVTGGFSSAKGENLAFNNSLTRSGSPLFRTSLGVNGSRLFSEVTNLSNENTLTYTKTIKNHSINILGGYTSQSNKSNTSGLSAIKLPNEILGLSGLDDGTPSTITATSSAWALQSFLARTTYNFKSLVLVTASIRADGSSKFKKENRWGYFPSAAIAYRISEEKFMKAIKPVSDAKLRLSYGATGNNRVGDFSTFSSNDMFTYSFGNQVPLPGSAPSMLGNPDLKWETTKQLDIGLDMGLFNNRISITADYYRKVTKDLLLNALLPGSSGYSRAFKNIGSVANNGIELTINTENIAKGKFRWNSSFNISFNRNEVLALTNGEESLTSSSSGVYGNIDKYIAKVGRPIAMFYGPIFEGLYKYSEFNQLTNGTYVLKDDVPANGSARNTIQPGFVKYRDLNFDGTVDANDFTITGDPNPAFIGGLNNTFNYKGFDLNIFIQFSYGNDVMNANRIMFEGGTAVSTNTNMYATYANRWRPDNTNTNISNHLGRGPSYWSSLYVEDASYLRLKTVSLGYNVPGNILNKIKMKSLRIYVTSQNLYTLTRYSGLDPEVSVRNSALTPGLDYSPYPRAQTIVFGLNTTF